MTVADILPAGRFESNTTGWNVTGIGEAGEEDCFWLDVISSMPDYRQVMHFGYLTYFHHETLVQSFHQQHQSQKRKGSLAAGVLERFGYIQKRFPQKAEHFHGNRLVR